MLSPFHGLSNLTQGTVAVWVRIPSVSGDLSTQTVQIFDCGSSMSASISQLALSMTITSPSGQSTSLSSTPLSTNTLSSWNSLGFSFRNSTARIYLNGVLVASKPLPSALMSNEAESCSIGNSLDGQTGFNGQMRHLVFSKLGLDQTINVNSLIRAVAIPTDPNLLAAFQFQNGFGQHESLFVNASSNVLIKNVASESSSEPETVCYCTTTP